LWRDVEGGLRNVLFILSDPGLPENDLGLHEDLLTSDPSGMEGAPGSIDTVV
jgi:hypothetical protein